MRCILHCCSEVSGCIVQPNQSAAANRRPAGQVDGSGDLSAIVAADRAFPAAVAELGSLARFTRHEHHTHFRSSDTRFVAKLYSLAPREHDDAVHSTARVADRAEYRHERRDGSSLHRFASGHTVRFGED